MDQCKENERKIILFTMLLVLILGSIEFGFIKIISVIDKQASSISNAINLKNSQQIEIDNIKMNAQKNPNVKKQKEIDRLVLQSVRVEREIESYTSAFVDARQMGQLLASIMDRYSGLELKQVQNSPFVPVEIPGIAEPWLYRHDLFLEMEGSYLDVMDYVRHVEGLPRKIQWQSLNFEVEEHPRGLLQVEVFTLSTSEEWIGT